MRVASFLGKSVDRRYRYGNYASVVEDYEIKSPVKQKNEVKKN
jgi:hypothetical protein